MSPEELSRYIDRQVTGGRMPSASWWVEESGNLLSSGAAGEATIETVFDLASLTKPLATALMAVILESGGKLDLDTALSTLLPGMSGSRFADVSLVELGAHLAGLPSWSPLYLKGDSREDYTKAIADLAEEGRRGEPLYSDLSYLLLGFALEESQGETLDAMFDRLVAGPLGLGTTGYSVPPGRFAEAAPTERGNRYERLMTGEAGAGFSWRSGVIRGEVHDCNCHYLGGVAGHAGLFGTASEVAAIARELLIPDRLAIGHGGCDRLLSTAGRNPDRTFGFVTSRGSSAARGVLPPDAVGHTGFTGTSVWIEPVRGRIYVLLTNRVHPSVPEGDFQPVRSGFHRLAAAIDGEKPTKR